ncbi:hypothetical protein PVT71_12390 [Salipiger sp. H15]|uniref:Uncharacterized protein n=1 Tax=Alloyangia sp. H15 TaxID=3029062 RepID=A0AAU8AEU8_9RHOB
MTLSSESACTLLSRGVVTRAMREAQELAQTAVQAGRFRGGRSGHSAKALGRVAARLKRDRSTVAARVTGTRSRPVLEVLRRVPECLTERPHRGETYAIRGITYEVAEYDPVRPDPDTSINVGLIEHAMRRWVERGGAGDPREHLLRKLDAEVLRIVRLDDFRLAVRNAMAPGAVRRTFGIPSGAGLWVAATSLTRYPRGDYVRGVSLRTFLGPHELNDSQQAYQRLAEAEGIPAAEARFPHLFKR